MTRAYGWTFRELVSGRLEARSANALGALLGGLLAAVKSSDIEARLEALERALRLGGGPKMSPLERRIVHLEQRAVDQGGRVDVVHVRRLVRHHWFPGRLDRETDERVEVEARGCIAAWEKFRALTGEKPSCALRWIEALVRVIAALTPEEADKLLQEAREGGRTPCDR